MSTSSHRPNRAHDAERWLRVRRLFEQVVDAEPGARVQLLAETGRTDPETAREAAALLAQHEADQRGGGTFLSQAATLLEAGDERGQSAVPGSPRAGDRLGPWRLAAVLGEGGMGQVWEAFRADGRYDARVAIKVIRPDVDSRSVLERFALEQRTLARLNHPHIARLLDAGRTANGAPYFVLEAVQGRPIDKACSGLELRQRVRLFLQLADAVAFAHRHLLVHRDLKPGNVLVSDDGQVKLLDFGIARAIAGDPGSAGETDHDSGDSGATLLGLTPAFASPEQVRGEPVGTATDVYALGLLLHLMLTGTRAYGRQARSAAAALRAVLDEDPLPPSRAPADEGGDPGVPRRLLRGDLDAVVARCLRKNADERYASVDALAADLRAWLDGHVLAAAEASALQRAWKFAQRNRAATAAALLAAVVLLLGLGASAWRAQEAVSGLALIALVAGIAASAWQARRARAAREQAEQRLQATRQIARDIVLRYADTITFLPGGVQLKASLLADTIAHLERLAQVHGGGSDAALAGDLALAHARLADVQVADVDLTLDDTEACRRNAERALDLFPRGEAAYRDDPRYLMWWARTMRNLANSARVAGDAQASLRWRERQRDLLHLGAQRFPGDHELQHELGSALIGIGQAYDTWARADLAQPKAAAAALDQARQVYEALAAADPADSVAQHQLGVIHGALMLSLFKHGASDEAAEHGRIGVAYKRAALTLEPANTAYRQALAGECSNLAMVLNDARRFDEALPLAQESAALLRALEADDPTLPTWPQRRRYFGLSLGRALLGTGDAAAAIVLLRECLDESAGAAGGAARRRRGHNQLLLAQALAVCGEAGPAREAAAAARADLESVLAADRDDAECCMLLAELCWFEAGTGAAGHEALLAEAAALLDRAAARGPLRPHAVWLKRQVASSLLPSRSPLSVPDQR